MSKERAQDSRISTALSLAEGALYACVETGEDAD